MMGGSEGPLEPPLSGREGWQWLSKALLPPSQSPYPADVVQRIQRLADSSATFLEGAPGFPFSIHVSEHVAAIQGALVADHRLAQWMPKLVPRRVSEDAFWGHYLSHIAHALHTAGLLPPADGAAPTITAAVESRGSSASPTPPSTASKEPPFASPAGNGRPAPSSASHPNPSTSTPPSAFSLPSIPSLPSPTPSPSLLQWGLVGCGRAAERVLPSLLKCAGSTVVAVFGVKGRAAALVRRFDLRQATVHSSLQALLSDERVHCVYVATAVGSPAHGSHAEIGAACAAYSRAAVFHRPLARSGTEGRVLVEAFERSHANPSSASPPTLLLHQPLCALHGRLKQRLTAVQPISSISYTFASPVLPRWSEGQPWVTVEGSSSALPLLPSLTPLNGGPTLPFLCDLFDVLHAVMGEVRGVRGAAAHWPTEEGKGPQVESVVQCSFRCGPALGVATIDLRAKEARDELTFRGERGEVQLPLYPPAVDEAEDWQALVEGVRRRLSLAAADASADVSFPPPYLEGRRALLGLFSCDAALRSFHRLRTDEYWHRPHTWALHDR